LNVKRKIEKEEYWLVLKRYRLDVEKTKKRKTSSTRGKMKTRRKVRKGKRKEIGKREEINYMI
jgi:hypothetical protein